MLVLFILSSYADYPSCCATQFCRYSGVYCILVVVWQQQAYLFFHLCTLAVVIDFAYYSCSTITNNQKCYGNYVNYIDFLQLTLSIWIWPILLHKPLLERFYFVNSHKISLITKCLSVSNYYWIEHYLKQACFNFPDWFFYFKTQGMNYGE